MPSVELMPVARRVVGSLALLLTCVALSGCAGLFKPKAAAGAPGVQSQVATAAAATPMPAAKAATPEAAVSPATQRAFDEARRLMRAGRLDDAERALLALTRSDPLLGGPHANLGVIYRDSGNRLEAGIAALERAVALSPGQALFHNELGVAYRQAGQFDKARQAYERALALDANCAPAVLNLGILSDLYLGDGARALALYERYLALTPAGDAAVSKWVADLKNRKPVASAAATAPKKETR